MSKILMVSALALLLWPQSLLSLKQTQLFPSFPKYNLPEQHPSWDFGSPVRPFRSLSLEHFQQPSAYTSTRLLNLARQSSSFTPILLLDQPTTLPVKRFVNYLLLQESLTRWHYHWGTLALPGQRSQTQLHYYFLSSYWFQENLQKFLAQSEYGFPELSLVRTLSAIQTSAFFLEVSYPTIFCLFFKESRLDYKVVSASGARGLGQLTGIAVKQIELLREDTEEQARLQAALHHLHQRYADPTWQGLLTELGYKEGLPQNLSLPPKTVVPTLSASLLLPEVQKRLQEEQLPYASKTSQIRRRLNQLRQGRPLSLKYAPIYAHYVAALEESYAGEPGNIFHIETNILLSTLLFRHYLQSEWRYGKSVWKPKPKVHRVLAVAAYNQGQSSARSLFRLLQKEIGKKPEEITLKEFLEHLTPQRVQQALKGSKAQARELIDHALNVAECAESSVVLPNQNF
jgi:hypothetical protein